MLDNETTQGLSIIDGEVSEYLQGASGIVIDSAEEFDVYNELLTFTVDRKKALDALKKTATAPMLEALSAVRAMFKPAEDRCIELESRIKSAIGVYRDRAAAAARAALESLKAETTTVSEAAAALAVVATASAAVEGGATTQRAGWSFTTAVESEIPREYLMLDEAKVRAAIKAGVREIPGLIIVKTTSTVMKSTRGRKAST